MRDNWLHDHLGDEARPTARFEAQLADTLHAAWADPQGSVAVSPQQPTAPQRSMRPWLAAAAAVAVFGAGGIYLATDDGKPQITGESTVTTVADTSPASTDSSSTTSPSTTVTTPGDVEQVTVTIDDTTRRLTGVPVTDVDGMLTAAVLPSGRVFVGVGPFDGEGLAPLWTLFEVVDGIAVPTNLSSRGSLRVALDERLYVVDQEASTFSVYREASPQLWVLDESLPLQGEGACQFHPDAYTCGGSPSVMQSPVPAAEIVYEGNLLFAATTPASTHRWQLTLAGPTVSLGDCEDDMCLVQRPYGPDGMLWTPFLAGTEASVIVALRPNEPAITALLPCFCRVVGVVDRSLYVLMTGTDRQVQRFDLFDAVTAGTPEEQTVLDYLAALADGRYEDAAKLLGEGGMNWEERSDLRPLAGTDGALNDLAVALQEWCESPAMCVLPTAMTTVDNQVVATFTVDGIERSSTFSAGTYEGSALVTGLPLRLPPEGVALADTVACPTAEVADTSFADLDGDGWDEVIVDTQDASYDHTISVCGTTLVVPPLFIGSPNTLVSWTVDINGDGIDELMSGGFNVNTLFASVIRWDGAALGYTGQDVTHSPPLDGAAGTSFGCESIAGIGIRLVQYTYQYEGGTSLSDSTALTFSRTILNDDGTVNPIPLPAGRYELPAQEEQAFRLIAGYCGNLPVITG